MWEFGIWSLEWMNLGWTILNLEQIQSLVSLLSATQSLIPSFSQSLSILRERGAFSGPPVKGLHL